MPSSELDELQWKAVDQYLRRCTVPILFERAAGRGADGTGFFLEAADSVFLVTASHVASCVDKKSGVPVSPTGGALITLGSFEVFRTGDGDDHDIAIIDLRDDEFKKQIRANWTFVRPANLTSQFKRVDEFIVAGYPLSGMRPTQEGIVGSMFMLRTRRYQGQEAGEPTPADLILGYGKDIHDKDGTRFDAPPLEGISGCPVWAICCVHKDRLWSAETQVKVCAFEVAYKRDAYIRAKKIFLVAQAIAQVHPAAGAEIMHALQEASEDKPL